MKKTPKLEPKTPEERREEAAKEAMGVEESGGMLEEMLDQVEELTEELEPEAVEELTEGLEPEAVEELTEGPGPEAVAQASKAAELSEAERLEQFFREYRGMDLKV